jgi:hypothetical protein
MAPAAPAGPDRMLLLAAVLAAGIALGVGGALTLHHLDDPVTSAEGLAAAFPWPVLGAVALVPAAGGRVYPWARLPPAVAGLALVALFAAAIIIEMGRRHGG